MKQMGTKKTLGNNIWGHIILDETYGDETYWDTTYMNVSSLYPWVPGKAGMARYCQKCK
jgi:hypothetical protein